MKCWQNATLGIEFDFLANGEVNALAVSNDSIEAIGINFGLISYLQTVIYGIFSCPEFFPDIGEAKAEATTSERITESIVTLDVRQGWRTYIPQDFKGYTVANEVSALAEAFILFHETAHITYGHPLHPHLDEKNGLKMIPEYQHATPAGYRLLQVMEFDADEAAAVQSLDFAIETLETRPIMFTE